MKKGMIGKNELTDLFKTLLKQFPPTSEKNIKKAFQEFISLLQDERFDVTIVYGQWLDIYKPNKVAEEIAEEIPKAPKKRLSGFNLDSHMGKRGYRGISKEWIPCLDAEQILFDPKSVMDRFKLNLDLEFPSEFLSLIRLHAKGKLHELPDRYDKRTMEILWWAVIVLCSVFEKFIKAYNPKEKKHGEAIALLLGKNHPWATENIGPGKRVTRKSIEAAINAIRKHINHGKPINSRAYTDKKFYYLTYLVSFCVLYIDFDPERTRAIQDIQTILNPFAASDRLKIAKEAVDKQNFSDEMLSRLSRKKK